MAFHPVYSSLASGSEDCTIKIWDWEYGQLERTLKGHRRPILGLDYGGPKNQIQLASCSSDLTIKIWDPSNEYANVRTLCGHDHSVSAVRFLTPNENLLVSVSRDASIRIWDTSTGYCIRTIDSQGEWIRDIVPSWDGRYVVSAGNDRAATIWEVSSGDAVARLVGHENKIECCVVAPTASYEYLAALEPTKSREEGMLIATGSRDSTVKLWNERGQLLKTLEGHDTWIRGLAFHPGGKYLLSVSDDKTIRCWDLSQEGRLTKTVKGASAHFLSCIRWGPSVIRSGGTSHVLAIGSADSSVRVWM
jgi:platelet-activating factor acetylhydrolase IB subunit alpha